GPKADLESVLPKGDARAEPHGPAYVIGMEQRADIGTEEPTRSFVRVLCMGQGGESQEDEGIECFFHDGVELRKE
ncbi:MAG TPA: hypothetical protein DCE41_19415, partial [Cytophagales bacterium]|nr:hypothetical protein [Cytophagales bacterium]